MTKTQYKRLITDKRFSAETGKISILDIFDNKKMALSFAEKLALDVWNLAGEKPFVCVSFKNERGTMVMVCTCFSVKDGVPHRSPYNLIDRSKARKTKTS